MTFFMKKSVDSQKKIWYDIGVVAKDSNAENLDNWTVKHILENSKRYDIFLNDRKILKSSKNGWIS